MLFDVHVVLLKFIKNLSFKPKLLVLRFLGRHVGLGRWGCSFRVARLFWTSVLPEHIWTSVVVGMAWLQLDELVLEYLLKMILVKNLNRFIWFCFLHSISPATSLPPAAQLEVFLLLGEVGVELQHLLRWKLLGDLHRQLTLLLITPGAEKFDRTRSTFDSFIEETFRLRLLTRIN